MSSGPVVDAGIVGGWAGDPLVEGRPAVVAADGDDRVHASRARPRSSSMWPKKSGPTTITRGCVVDDLRHLGRGQPPVHGHADRAELGQAESDLEELGAVLVDERDPVTETHAGGPEGVGGPARAGVELAEGDRPLADLKGATSPRSAPCTRTMSATLAMPSIDMAHLSMAPRQFGRFDPVSRSGARHLPSTVREGPA